MLRLKNVLLVAMVTSLLAAGAPNANAAIFTGACAMSLTFSFDTPVTAVPRAISYSVTGGPARVAGVPTPGCAVDTSPLSPIRPTSASGFGNSVTWTCEATVGLGSWEQSWSPDPPAMFGAHAITGTYGAWTMVITSPSLNFTGEMELTVDPLDATKLAQCPSNGISSLRMIGVMHFQDPAV